jgi:subtilisin family serine protease
MNPFQIHLRWLIPAFLFCVLVAGSVSPLRADDCDDDDDICGPFVPNQVVVKLAQSTGVTVDAINDAYQTTTLETFLSSLGIYLLQTPPNTDVETLIGQMASDPRLLYAEPNFIGEAPEDGGRGTKAWGGQDPAPYPAQYALELLGISAAHEINRGGGTIVAVLDTGVQLSHPLFASSLTTAQYDFIDDDSVPEDEFNLLDDDGDGFVDETTGHGTHVAGIVKLAAPDARIMPLRVLDSDGRGNVFVIAEAVFYAAQQGADVINLSLGTSDESELLEEIITDAVETHDVFVVAAAGNLNSQLEQYPAALDPVLAVTSLGSDSRKSGIANYGSWVDLAAPGQSIYSAFPPNGYAWWSGTSMATPFVAGQAALQRSECPAFTAEEVFARIQATAQPLDALNPAYAGLLGAGRPDFVAGLQAPCGGNQDDNDDDDDSDDEEEEQQCRCANSETGVTAGRVYLPLVAQR